MPPRGGMGWAGPAPRPVPPPAPARAGSRPRAAPRQAVSGPGSAGRCVARRPVRVAAGGGTVRPGPARRPRAGKSVGQWGWRAAARHGPAWPGRCLRGPPAAGAVSHPAVPMALPPGCPASRRHHPDSHCGERIRSARPKLGRTGIFGRGGRRALLTLTVIGRGRYPSWTSMRFSMPAVPAQRGWSRGSGCGDSPRLDAHCPGRGATDQVPHVKAYHCAHFQPQGR